MYPTKLNLRIQFPSMIYSVNITPLTLEAGQLNADPLKGAIQLVTSSNVNNLDSSFIAYMNCELAGDRSNGDDIFSAAINRYPMAIILYSTTSSFCTLTPSSMGTLQYNALYSMATVASAIMFENLLKQSQAALAMISPSSTTTQLMPTGTPSSNSGTSLSSPTTTVAMIILYSITGLVTALFLIIIATGAIRAHRHPERYGPRMTGPLGRQRQSRAKGLARAVLESIPIVKFGERDDKQPASDVELGPDQQQPTLAGGDGAADIAAGSNRPSEPGDSARDGEPRSASPRVDEDPAVASANPSVTGDSDQIQPSIERPPTSSDEGLSCSICTEDFVKGEDIRVLPCNHKYHPDCVDPWLLNVSGTCPLCRIDLTNNLNHDLDNSPPPPNPDADSSLPPPLDFPPGTSSTQTDSGTITPPSRRSRYLDLRRLAHAHPEERLSILRWLREANQQARDQDGLQRRRASRLSGMFRVIGIRNGRADEQVHEDGGGSSPARSRSSPARSESPLESSSPPASPSTAEGNEAARGGAEAGAERTR
ncbi:MAG: hypothetical protein M1840_001532 [Geoglossum simile]|nr:MAG: hypothetical protein M1840_001532 [Geoglossum simile]